MLYLLDSISSDPNQQMNLVIAGYDSATFNLYWIEQQKGWFWDGKNLGYGDYDLFCNECNNAIYLRNKNNDKTIYNKYSVDDLYKASILTFVEGNCEGGILIIPLNFFSGEDNKVRNLFLIL